MTAKDDRLPQRILVAAKDGGAAGSVPDMKVLLEEFYPARGLAPDGRPTKETLARLGLNDLSAKLYRH
jgi:aldehyde:ferredoxin oxidoreductase